MKYLIGVLIFLYSNMPWASTSQEVCKRTEQIKKSIEAQIQKPCIQITSNDLLTIQTLQFLNTSKITSLKPGDFAGMTNLSDLTIVGLNTKTLPEDLFRGLTKLSSVIIVHGFVEELPEKLFQDNYNLTQIKFAFNSIHELPAGLFYGLKNLTSIDFRSNKIEDLPENLFDGLFSLKILNLSDNTIKTILRLRNFKDLDNLESLEINSSNLNWTFYGTAW